MGARHTSRRKTLHGVLEEKGVDAEVELVGINTAEEARELRFPGSPTIRVDEGPVPCAGAG